jgi:hypothetical protein
MASNLYHYLIKVEGYMEVPLDIPEGEDPQTYIDAALDDAREYRVADMDDYVMGVEDAVFIQPNDD